MVDVVRDLRVIVGVALALGACGKPPASAPTPDPASQATPALEARLAAALAAKGPTYVPRTRFKDSTGHPTYTNRLILETSPYLLQHAHNPVDWYPWGDEAFKRAAELGRPVFVSIGYSTCHWCHVMEEESFENEAIATYLNAHYVAIKVDREERPDVDAVYMAYVQRTTGRGGWPMSVWLTPERLPFAAGTYFPPDDSARGPGFLSVLTRQADLFSADPAAVRAQARDSAQQLQAAAVPAAPGELAARAQLAIASERAAIMFDADNGGRRGAPKFPSSFPIRLLLRQSLRLNDTTARTMALSTLDHIASGGIRDQLGGGFHRYATRADWNVPHYEKMLYDNALLASAYLEAGQLSGDARYLTIAHDALADVVRTFGRADGTLASATDADSPTEGRYFTWTPAELTAALGPDAAAAAAYYGVVEHGPVDGRSGLSARGPVPDSLSSIHDRLLAVRAERPPPLRDDKALTAWNALAITALARTAIVMNDATLAHAAIAAATPFAAELRAGRPVPHELLGGPHGAAFLDDLALLGGAFIDVFELTGEAQWLRDAITIADDVEARFADRPHGGYFDTALGAEPLLFRAKTNDDGPTPSGNSAMAMLLVRLNALTLNPTFATRAEATLRAFGDVLTRAPLQLDQLLLAVDVRSHPSVEIVIALPHDPTAGALTPDARPLLDVLRTHFAPGASLVVVGPTTDLTTLVPWTAEKVAQHDLPTAYVCEERVCQLPATDTAGFIRALAAIYR